MIPPRQTAVEDKDVRFYVTAPASVRLALTQEAHDRGTDLWTLGGLVLAQWLEAGCPDGLSVNAAAPSPAPSPSSSVAGPQEPGG